MMKVGPFGLVGGKAWDEMGKTQICQIYICHGTRVNSIQTKYVEGNTLILSEKHGGEGFGNGDGTFFDRVTLDYPGEYLTSIRGSYDCRGINSISFGTNRRTFGPFGTSDNGAGHKKYGYGINFGEEFFGFHGRSDLASLSAIGVHMKPSVGLRTGPMSVKSEPIP